MGYLQRLDYVGRWAVHQNSVKHQSRMVCRSALSVYGSDFIHLVLVFYSRNAILRRLVDLAAKYFDISPVPKGEIAKRQALHLVWDKRTKNSVANAGATKKKDKGKNKTNEKGKGKEETKKKAKGLKGTKKTSKGK